MLIVDFGFLIWRVKSLNRESYYAKATKDTLFDFLE
jgi:hypothetical protein